MNRHTKTQDDHANVMIEPPEGRGRRIAVGLMVLVSAFTVLTTASGWAQSEPATGAKPDRQICPDPSIEIRYSDWLDRDTVCGGAMDAKAFLGNSGFEVAWPIRICVVPVLPSGSPEAYGYFDGQSGLIHVLSFDASHFTADAAELFGEPISRALYRSIVAHEVAHLIAERNFAVEAPARAAQEYIAYATQFATMPAEIRSRILANDHSQGFRNRRRINSIIWMFSPSQFAVEAYRHFIRPENGTGFLRGLVNGEILLDEGV